MQLVPQEGKNARLTAILLLLISLLVTYLVFFHWFFQRHVAFAEEISGLKEQLGRFETIVAQRESLQAQLATVRASRTDAELFVDEPDFNEAAAAMAERLGALVEAVADEDCQIVSRQPVRPRVEERYQRVTVNVRMRCQGEDMLEILYRLESDAPTVLVEDLNVIRPRARRRGDDPAGDEGALLDIRFNMSSYLKS